MLIQASTVLTRATDAIMLLAVDGQALANAPPHTHTSWLKLKSLVEDALTSAKDAVVVVAVDQQAVRHRLLGPHAIHDSLFKETHERAAHRI